MKPGAPLSDPGEVSPARRYLIILVSAGATLALVALLGVLWVAATFFGGGPDKEAASIVQLRPGAGLSEIGDTLESAGAIRSAPVFVGVARLTGVGSKLKAGEYEVPAGASMASVLDLVKSGKVKRYFVTVPEGMASVAVAALLNQSPILSGIAPIPSEGSILPETYEISRGEDRAAVLQRMTDAHDKLIAALWPKRRPDLPVNSPAEAVILASVVEKETGLAAERPRVAAVFVNRLRRGMKLESDPTIIYGITHGEPLGRGLRLSEVKGVTPYNTYVIDGLPPTPICNPGRDAIAAVLDPPDSAELFFVADGSGGHAFAATYAEHLKNVAHWRQVEARQAVRTKP